jgi:ligand-binding sensor domain-containing protein
MYMRDTGHWLDAWMPRRVFIAMAGVCACANLIGQTEDAPPRPQPELMVKAWSVAEGLPHTSVTALAQTRDGYLWIGTQAGLVRFDGVQFKVFTPQNCPELPRSRIGRLFEGADGTLFITTERGGGLVALREGKFERLLGSRNEQDEIVTALKEASGNSLFVARSGALWRWANGRLSVLSTNRDFYPVSPADVCADDHGRVWMVSGVDEASRLLRFEGGQACPRLRGALESETSRGTPRTPGGGPWPRLQGGLRCRQPAQRSGQHAAPDGGHWRDPVHREFP